LQPAHQSDYFRAEGANGLIPEIFRDNRRSAGKPRRVLNDRFVDADTNPVILCAEACAMSDPNEISALKASYRGALQTAQALADLSSRIEALSPPSDIGQADLDDLSRATAAHAIASAALRGLVNTMLARRGGTPAPQGSGEV
jgi:hypothetical protein